MKAATLLGIAWILLGILGLTLSGFNPIQQAIDTTVYQEQANHFPRNILPIPKAISITVIVSGFALILIGRSGPRKSRS